MVIVGLSHQKQPPILIANDSIAYDIESKMTQFTSLNKILKSGYSKEYKETIFLEQENLSS